jgi:hypothetical protein
VLVGVVVVVGDVVAVVAVADLHESSLHRPKNVYYRYPLRNVSVLMIVVAAVLSVVLDPQEVRCSLPPQGLLRLPADPPWPPSRDHKAPCYCRNNFLVGIRFIDYIQQFADYLHSSINPIQSLYRWQDQE